jgi:hypothetical protein
MCFESFNLALADKQAFPEADFTTLIVMPVKPVMCDYSRVGKLGKTINQMEVEQ